MHVCGAECWQGSIQAPIFLPWHNAHPLLWISLKSQRAPEVGTLPPRSSPKTLDFPTRNHGFPVLKGDLEILVHHLLSIQFNRWTMYFYLAWQTFMNRLAHDIRSSKLLASFTSRFEVIFEATFCMQSAALLHQLKIHENDAFLHPICLQILMRGKCSIYIQTNNCCRKASKVLYTIMYCWER